MAGATARVCVAVDLRLSDGADLACAVVEDGYGLAYAIGDNYLRWTITSLKRNNEEMKSALEWAANEMRGMMERAQAAEASVEKPKL